MEQMFIMLHSVHSVSETVTRNGKGQNERASYVYTGQTLLSKKFFFSIDF